LCNPNHTIQHRFSSPVTLIKRQSSLTVAVLISFGSTNGFPNHYNADESMTLCSM
jgi:hypothetical protein